MIIAFPEPCAPKGKNHRIFSCPLGSLEIVYIIVSLKINLLTGHWAKAWTTPCVLEIDLFIFC